MAENREFLADIHSERISKQPKKDINFSNDLTLKSNYDDIIPSQEYTKKKKKSKKVKIEDNHRKINNDSIKEEVEKEKDDLDEFFSHSKRKKIKKERKMKKQVVDMRELHKERWKKERKNNPPSNWEKPKDKLKNVFKKNHKKKKEEKEKNEDNNKKNQNEDDEDKKNDRSKTHRISEFVMTPLQIGKECLRLTNEFRKKHRKSPLAWNDEMYDIGMVHSDNMGNNRCEFSHVGFNDRAHKMRMFKNQIISGCAENIALCSDTIDAAEIAVKSWIKSPGHRKNLLSSSNFCSISPYKNKSGVWYFTQLFGSTGAGGCNVQ